MNNQSAVFIQCGLNEDLFRILSDCITVLLFNCIILFSEAQGDEYGCTHEVDCTHEVRIGFALDSFSSGRPSSRCNVPEYICTAVYSKLSRSLSPQTILDVLNKG